MARYSAALIDKDGVVVNTVIVDDAANWTPPEGLTLRPLARGDNAEPGGTFDGVAFVKRVPSPPPPKDEITLLKERVAALEAERVR